MVPWVAQCGHWWDWLERPVHRQRLQEWAAGGFGGGARPVAEVSWVVEPASRSGRCLVLATRCLSRLG